MNPEPEPDLTERLKCVRDASALADTAKEIADALRVAASAAERLWRLAETAAQSAKYVAATLAHYAHDSAADGAYDDDARALLQGLCDRGWTAPASLDHARRTFRERYVGPGTFDRFVAPDPPDYPPTPFDYETAPTTRPSWRNGDLGMKRCGACNDCCDRHPQWCESWGQRPIELGSV